MWIRSFNRLLFNCQSNGTVTFWNSWSDLPVFVAFNTSPAFRKLFPEYVDKYNQQLTEQAQSEESSSPSEEHNSLSPKERVGREARKERRNNRGQSIPTWMLLLLFSVLGAVMALPLLQL